MATESTSHPAPEPEDSSSPAEPTQPSEGSSSQAPEPTNAGTPPPPAPATSSSSSSGNQPPSSRGIMRFLWPRGRLRWVAIAGYLVVVVVIVVVILLLLLLQELSRPGEATAEYIPSDALVYSSINLRPGAGQINNARSVGDLLRSDDFMDEEDDLLDDVEDETGIHPLDDVTSWLGTDVTFALLDLDEDEDLIEWTLMVQISDRDEAHDFVDKLLEYLEDELYTEFDDDEIGGADVWIADDEAVAIGLTDEYLLIADSEDTIEDMLDNIDSPPTRSLAEDEQFIAAREALPEGRVMFVYAQVENYLEEIQDIVDPWDDVDPVWNWAESNTPEYVAASLSFIDKGVRFDVVSEAASRSLSLDSESGLRSAAAVPEDTLFLASYTGVTDAWEEFRDTLEDSDPWAAEDFDEFLDDMEDETGVDLERDVIESLTGEVSLAIMPSDISVTADAGELEGVIEALFLASLDDPRGIENALESLTDWIEDEGYDTDRESFGDYDGISVSLDQFDDDVLEDYEAGYVITEEWLAIGSSIDSLELFHDAVEGDTDSLSSADKYSNLAELAPNPLHLLVYADIAGILEMVVDGLDEDALEDYEDDVRPYVENLNAFMLASSFTDERWHFTAALTLQE